MGNHHSHLDRGLAAAQATDNAAECAQRYRQVFGADRAESDQEALLGWAGVEALTQAGGGDVVFGCGLQNLILAKPLPENGGDVKPGMGCESSQVASQGPR